MSSLRITLPKMPEKAFEGGARKQQLIKWAKKTLAFCEMLDEQYPVHAVVEGDDYGDALGDIVLLQRTPPSPEVVARMQDLSDRQERFRKRHPDFKG